MHRRASRDITLTDGLQIAKHTEIEMPCLHMWDESVYPEAGEFIPDRFLRMRRAPDQENLHQLVSTSPNHMGFGYGKYACPGRFFAAAEVKTALCHILMKYEVKLVGEPPAPHRIGTVLAANVFGRVSVRRRESEVLF
jgi:cytochrome P450